MVREIEPKDTTRAMAFGFWMEAPNPMVTFFKTMDVTNLVKVSKKRNFKFNMLLTYCIGKAAVEVKEFYMLPVGKKLMQYDSVAVNTTVKNKDCPSRSSSITPRWMVRMQADFLKTYSVRSTAYKNSPDGSRG